MNRITSLANLVPKNAIIADIGCDHAYLIIKLFKLKRIFFAYAIDNKLGPIQNAIVNISKNNLNHKCQIIKTDGLNFNFKHKINTLIFAGIGGYNAINIIENNKEKIQNINYIVTDLHRDNEKFKIYLESYGFKLKEKKKIFDKKHFYCLCKYERI